MSNTKKLTKKDFFSALYTEVQETGFSTSTISNEEMLWFINHELELLDRKNSADKKPTAQQVANAAVQEAILDAMNPEKQYTVTELMKTVPECADLTNQRVSALMRQLKDAGKVERIEDKRKAYFRKIVTE